MRMTPLGVYAGWARLHPSCCSLNPIPLYWCCRENTRVLPDLHQDRESSLFFSTSCPSQILSWPWMLLYPGGNRAMVPPSFALICRFWWEEGVCSSPLRRTDMNLLSGEEMSRSPYREGHNSKCLLQEQDLILFDTQFSYWRAPFCHLHWSVPAKTYWSLRFDFLAGTGYHRTATGSVQAART